MNTDISKRGLHAIAKKNKSLFKVLDNFNKTKADLDESDIVKCFISQVQQRPNAVAVIFGEKSYTYHQLDIDSTKIAKNILLKTEGKLAANQCVCLLMSRSYQLISVMLAILKVGATYVPIDPLSPKERVNYVLKDCDSQLLVTELIHEKRQSYCQELIIDNATDDVGSVTLDLSERHSNHIAYVMYTSGSTGQPKGVKVTHEGVVRLVSNNTTLVMSPAIRFAQINNIAFDAATLEIWGPLLNGGSLTVIPYEVVIDTRALAARLKCDHVTDVLLTSALFNQFCADNPKGLGTIQNVFIGGDVLSPKAVERVLMSGAPPANIWNCYGPTENAVITTMHKVSLEDCNRLSIPIGKPISNTVCYVLDDDLNLLPVGSVGELYTSGAGLSDGYLNQIEKTAKVFVDNPFYQYNGSTESSPATSLMYKTGDKVRWLESGVLEFIGRVDNQVKIRGFRLELGEVESVLCTLPQVEQAIVILKVSGTKKRLVAYCVSQQHPSDILADFSELVPAYMLPAQIFTVDDFPLTPNGKVDKQALCDRSISTDIDTNFLTGIETDIALIWKSVLDSTVSINQKSSFFELGGNSLHIVKIKQKIYEKWAVNLSIVDMFSHLKFKDLCQLVEHKKTETAVETLPLALIDKAEEEDKFPLSYEQERLWFVEKNQGASSQYNISTAFRLDATLDVSRLELAFHHLIDKHHSLKVTVVEYDGVAYQTLLKNKFSLQTIMVDSYEELLIKMEKDRSIPFEFGNEPMFRVRLYYFNSAYYLLLNMHHIVTDGWSMGILYRELEQFYCNETLRLKPPASNIQFTDYCVWQKKQDYTNEIQYWMAKLEGVQPLQLPIESTSSNCLHSKTLTFTLNDKVTKDLEAFALERNTSLFNVLYSAVSILLSQYSGQKDICIASVWANRSIEQVSDQIGFFANTILLRNSVTAECDLHQFVKDNHIILTEAFEHGAAPFDQVLNKFDMPRHGMFHPLCTVALVLQNTVAGNADLLTLGDLLVQNVPLESAPAKFDLLLNASVTLQKQLKIEMTFRDIVWSSNIMEQLKKSLNQLLKQLSHVAKNTKIIDLSNVSNRLTEQLVLFNKTKAELEFDNIIECFLHSVQNTPNDIAVTDSGVHYTYQKLNDISDRISYEILGYLRPEDVVGQYIAFSLTRGIYSVSTMVAILKLGAIYVPLDPNMPSKRRNYILNDCKSPLHIVDDAVECRLTNTETLNLSDVRFDSQTRKAARERLKKVSSMAYSLGIAYLMYTSGSTGKPKGVKVTHEGVLRLVKNNALFPINQNSVFSHISNISFDASTMEVWGPLLNSGTVSILPYDTIVDPEELMAAYIAQGITDSFVTVALFDQLALSNPAAFRCLNNLIVGGDVLNPKVVEKVLNSDHPPKRMWNGYGPTENTTFSTMHPIKVTDCKRGSIPIGKPITNTTCYVLNENLQPVPLGVTGELYLSGQGLALGYLNDEAKTAQAFLANPFIEHNNVTELTPASKVMYKTGDSVRWRSDGSLEFIGRIDNQVKIRGFRLELGELESEIIALPDVFQAVVLTSSEVGQKQLIAYCVSSKSSGDISKALRHKVPSYMMPSKLIVVEDFPLTSNGKVDKVTLSKLNQNIQSPIKVSLSVTETKLALIWCSLLNCEPLIDCDTHFFDIGGHSLLVINMVHCISDTFGINLEVRQIFESPTLSDLAQCIDGKQLSEPDKNSDVAREDQWLELPLRYKTVPEGIAKNVLLTGSTGFLGIHLLAEIQQKDVAVVTCLIRAESEKAGIDKLMRMARNYKVSVDFTRIAVVCGDMNKRQLGLESSVWDRLSKSIDAVYHCGAWVNHLHNYTTLRNANVLSTLDLLFFCQKHKAKTMFYISTLSSAPHCEKQTYEKYVAESIAIENGYAQSKWVSERLMERAFLAGLSGTIYRMGNITGCTRHGISNADINHTLNLIKGCVQMGVAPNWASHEIDISPVDKLAELLVDSSMNNMHLREAVNLGFLTSISWKGKITHLIEKGHDIKFICPQQWSEEWVANLNKDNALFPFKSFYTDHRDEEKRVVTNEYVTSVAMDLDVNSLLDNYSSYWKNTGFII